jgi:glycerol-3-phosphate acyltransferase PlsY
MIYIKQILIILAAYLLGCFCTGYYLTRFCAGADIREHNSKTTGARNVSRTLGKKGFIFTFSGDFLKGAIAVILALAMKVPEWTVIAAMVAVVAGHVYPVQLGFRGGKGVATMLGALLIYDYRFLIVLLAIFGLLFILSRRYIISGLVAIIALPFIALVTGHQTVGVVGIVILTILILWAHRVHLRNTILAGQKN